MELWVEIMWITSIAHLNKATGDSGERFGDHTVIHLLEVLKLADQVGSKEKLCGMLIRLESRLQFDSWC